jgi:hypothetical protein
MASDARMTLHLGNFPVDLTEAVVAEKAYPEPDARQQ